MKTIYHISGLGADDRVFKFLQLKDVNEKFIPWIKPDSQESLSDYCKRLTSQIDPADKIVLIGISFGGIVAQEISKHIKVDKVIIVSMQEKNNSQEAKRNIVKSAGNAAISVVDSVIATLMPISPLQVASAISNSYSKPVDGSSGSPSSHAFERRKGTTVVQFELVHG